MRRIYLNLVVASAACTSGCYSYSNFQSAKLLQPGKVAITPSASYNTFHDEGYNGEIDDWVFDLQLRSGITPRFELGAKFSRIRSDEEGYQFIAIDPKIGLSPGLVAFSCPFGTFFGNGISSDLQVHPTLLTTFPIDPGRAEMDAAFKLMLFFADENEELLAFNVGPRLSSDLDRWAIQPELGFLFNPDAGGYFFQFGIGFMVSP